MDERDWRIAGVLFVLISSVYFATAAGITSSNDGSHYALVRALVDKRSFEISEYLTFTENQDYALNGDRRFSDRPPGTALLAAPLDAAAHLLPRPLVSIPSKHDPGNPRLAYVLVLPAAAGSATALIVFWILRAHYGLSEWTSVFTSLAFAFGTMAWKYGSLLYSHAASGLAVMAATALMLRWGAREVRWHGHFAVGLLLGAGVLIEYTNIVFVALAGGWWVWHTASFLRRPAPAGRRRGPAVLAALAGPLIPAAFLMWYNTANFGSPFALSTFSADITRWPQNESFLTDFATPLWVGLPAMLFYGHDNQGLFWLAPVALLGLPGLTPMRQRSRREFFLVVGVFLAMLLLFSTSTTFNPYTNDGRYLAPFLGLWFVAVGFGLERVLGGGLVAAQGRPPTHGQLRAPERPPGQGQPQPPSAQGRQAGLAPREAIVYALFFLSIRNQVMHVALSWGHDLNLSVLRPWSAAPENIGAVWQAVFPNALNLPLWWGLMSVGWLLYQLVRLRARTVPGASRADA